MRRARLFQKLQISILHLSTGQGLQPGFAVRVAIEGTFEAGSREAMPYRRAVFDVRKNKCTTYTLGANDTCRDLARKNLLTEVQLVSWNPILGHGCRHIKRSVGDSICLSPPGDSDWSPITIPSMTASPTETATAVPVPTDAAEGTAERCAEYYLVQPGDYCNTVLLKYGITLEDFLFLNQGVNGNCTNLFAHERYCVRPVGSIDQYPGHPGYIGPDESITYVPGTEFPDATYVPQPVTNQTTMLPYAPGTRRNCLGYADGYEFQAASLRCVSYLRMLKASISVLSQTGTRPSTLVLGSVLLKQILGIV
ncbi:hypothetical protein BJY04DRAFT_214189 [Aspergillus karnatakaensis]|uniref:LysM peptidoglycan-binding domain-containing protein n=1 Tax=Aspergillus karnatakaensis TaxID=1810916 RepID=UPI003CCD0AEA